jgi:hypothetical protein
VLVAKDVPLFGECTYVADPFLLVEDDVLHMFFEILNHRRSPDSVIGYANSSDRGRHWKDFYVVLSEPFHTSFPYVFELNGEHYMLPEQGRPPSEVRMRLYRASEFPLHWQVERELFNPDHSVDDAVLFQYDEELWVIAGDRHNDALNVYHSPTIDGEWVPHEGNPVVSDRPRAMRPAGRPIRADGEIFIPYQDCEKWYGHRVRLYKLNALTHTTYDDTEIENSPILEPSKGSLGWNSGGMHHIDAQKQDGKWIFAVDGNVEFGRFLFGAKHWSIGIYTGDDVYH